MIPIRGNHSTLRKISTNANMPSTNPTWSGRGLNPVIRGERSPTNRLMYDKASGPVTIFISELSHGGDGGDCSFLGCDECSMVENYRRFGKICRFYYQVLCM